MDNQLERLEVNRTYVKVDKALVASRLSRSPLLKLSAELIGNSGDAAPLLEIPNRKGTDFNPMHGVPSFIWNVVQPTKICHFRNARYAAILPPIQSTALCSSRRYCHTDRVPPYFSATMRALTA